MSNNIVIIEQAGKKYGITINFVAQNNDNDTGPEPEIPISIIKTFNFNSDGGEQEYTLPNNIVSQNDTWEIVVNNSEGNTITIAPESGTGAATLTCTAAPRTVSSNTTTKWLLTVTNSENGNNTSYYLAANQSGVVIEQPPYVYVNFLPKTINGPDSNQPDIYELSVKSNTSWSIFRGTSLTMSSHFISGYGNFTTTIAVTNTFIYYIYLNHGQIPENLRGQILIRKENPTYTG
ncbi:MAG: hypothetical protein LBF88_07125 [Planctomycetaceae bacterium]|jgi:hypothetical protein|nr:hypothetical protein [Planctomycetaceae bacterium]